MSEIGDDFEALKQFQRERRDRLSVPCPVCVEKLPKAHPKKLMPGGWCKMHKYRDPRPYDEDEGS